MAYCRVDFNFIFQVEETIASKMDVFFLSIFHEIGLDWVVRAKRGIFPCENLLVVNWQPRISIDGRFVGGNFHNSRCPAATWGVEIEEFLNSYTKGTFQQITLDSYYPAPQHFDNYVPEEFQQFMDENVQEWINLGVLEKWNDVKSPTDPDTPLVVSPLGVEPKKTSRVVGWKICEWIL